MKPLFMTAAIVIAVTAAFATRPGPVCENERQYFRMSTPWGCFYWPAGELGVDYICDYSPAATCTWYQPGSFGSDWFLSCQQGQYIPLCWSW